MTVGWILEKDTQAFFEGTQKTPDPSLSRALNFLCPFCRNTFPSQNEFNAHVYGKHRVERPFIMLRGREPSGYAVLRLPPTLSEIDLENTSHVNLSIDGSNPRKVSIDTLRERIVNSRLAELKIELVNTNEHRGTPVVTQYAFSFRVAEKDDLQRVELAFREILVSESLTRNSISQFLADERAQGVGREYASGLATYCLGILIKEQPEGENLMIPFSRYRELYVSALDVLQDFEQPLSQLISSIIRLSLNNFQNSRKLTGYLELDLLFELLSNPKSDSLPRPLDNTNRRPVCPIDHGTTQMIDLARYLTKQSEWSPILDNECRSIANSGLLDDTDRQKALAIWAASAWRLGSPESALEPLTQIAEIHPFSRWAGKYLEQVST